MTVRVPARRETVITKGVKFGRGGGAISYVNAHAATPHYTVHEAFILTHISLESENYNCQISFLSSFNGYLSYTCLVCNDQNLSLVLRLHTSIL